jgi:hypothetical protein
MPGNPFQALADLATNEDMSSSKDALKLGQELEGLTVSMKKSRLIHLRYEPRNILVVMVRGNQV